MSSFCICKIYSHFFSINTCKVDILLTRTVNILTTDELAKLTMLSTTGPRLLTFQILPRNLWRVQEEVIIHAERDSGVNYNLARLTTLIH